MFFSCSNDLSSFNRVCFEGFSSGFTTFSMTFWPACWVFSMNSYTISEFLSKAWELAWHKKCFAATIVLFLPRSVRDCSNFARLFAFEDLFWFLLGVFERICERWNSKDETWEWDNWKEMTIEKSWGIARRG